MNNPRATFFFTNHVETQGWSETLWNLGVTDLQTVMDNAQTLAAVRVLLLAQSVTLDSIRVSFDDTFRDSIVQAGPAPTETLEGTSFYDAQIGRLVPAPFNVALNMRLNMGNNYRATHFLGGIPADIAKAYVNGIALPVRWNNNLQHWRNAVARSPWAISVLPKGGDGPAATNIQAILFSPAPVAVTSAGHGLIGGTPVRIRQVKAKGGRFSCSNVPVAVIDANTFTLPTYNRPVPTSYVGGGNVQNVTRTLQLITSASPVRITHHKRGRVFNQQAGRERIR